jgi:preprotein translocase subunit SecA
MFKNIAKALGGDPQKRELGKATTLVDQINQLETRIPKSQSGGTAREDRSFPQAPGGWRSLVDLLV